MQVITGLYSRQWNARNQSSKFHIIFLYFFSLFTFCHQVFSCNTYVNLILLHIASPIQELIMEGDNELVLNIYDTLERNLRNNLLPLSMIAVNHCSKSGTTRSVILQISRAILCIRYHRACSKTGKYFLPNPVPSACYTHRRVQQALLVHTHGIGMLLGV